MGRGKGFGLYKVARYAYHVKSRRNRHPAEVDSIEERRPGRRREEGDNALQRAWDGSD